MNTVIPPMAVTQIPVENSTGSSANQGRTSVENIVVMVSSRVVKESDVTLDLKQSKAV